MTEQAVFSEEDMSMVFSVWARFNLGSLIFIQNRLAEIETIQPTIVENLKDLDKSIMAQVEWLADMISDDDNQTPIIHNTVDEFTKLAAYLEEKQLTNQ